MKVFVYPCFSPLGYQLVEYFLNSGVKVVGSGTLESDEETFYFMSVGRNANFNYTEFTDLDRDECFDQAYLINSELEVRAKQVITVHTSEDKQ
ncbi:hypothetical protein [Alkalibacillus aidingensis]|uniref:hypothetical protein n=1 Tax=Alkalibacillus aidingensis TaxID=2747607 RepID=UPI001CB6DF4D|nr:hypothetical protein [Alkalibacillus aidingensis]